MIDRLFSQFDPRIFGIQDASQRPCIFETTPKYKSNHNTQWEKRKILQWANGKSNDVARQLVIGFNLALVHQSQMNSQEKLCKAGLLSTPNWKYFSLTSYQKQLQDARNALEINLPFQRQTVIEWGF